MMQEEQEQLSKWEVKLSACISSRLKKSKSKANLTDDWVSGLTCPVLNA